MTDQQLFDEVSETVRALKWNPQLNGGWLVELMGERTLASKWKTGNLGFLEPMMAEMLKVWGCLPSIPHVWTAHSYKITPAVRLMEVLWELHRRGMTPYVGVGVWWHNARGVVGCRYWFCEEKEEILREGFNSEIVDRAFVRESILHAEHIEQEIIDAVEAARRRMWKGMTASKAKAVGKKPAREEKAEEAKKPAQKEGKPKKKP